MAKAQQPGWDAHKLAQLVGLFDSPVDGEAMAALHRIRVLKKKYGDTPFYELIERPDFKAAIWEKFGKQESLKGQSDTTALVEELRHDMAQLEQECAALALEVQRQEEIISELREQAEARPAETADLFCSALRVYLGGLFAFVLVIDGSVLIFAAAWHLTVALFRRWTS